MLGPQTRRTSRGLRRLEQSCQALWPSARLALPAEGGAHLATPSSQLPAPGVPATPFLWPPLLFWAPTLLVGCSVLCLPPPQLFRAVPLGHGPGGLSPPGGDRAMRGERGGGVYGSVHLTHLPPSAGLGFGAGVLICVRAGWGCPPHTLAQALLSSPWTGKHHDPHFTGRETEAQGLAGPGHTLSLQGQARFQPRYIVLQTGSD